MSRGYTRAFARAAPVAPATARPHAGRGASLDCAPIVMDRVADVCSSVGWDWRLGFFHVGMEAAISYCTCGNEYVNSRMLGPTGSDS
jgi:hypothetical protein